MKKIIFLLGAVFILLAFKPAVHEFYLSVTEIEYKQEKQSLQIITRVFIDDWENVLRSRIDDNIRLSHEKEEGSVRKAIERYLGQKLKLEIGGRELELKYLGKEYEADQLVLYIEVENVPDFKEIKVQNAILTDLFDDQKNVVHVKRLNKTKSLLLTRSSPADKIRF